MVEPVELYLGFDKAFFRPRRYDKTDAEAETEIEATAGRYKTLLQSNKGPLDAVLLNHSRPEELPVDVYRRLNGLVKPELKEENVRIRKFTGPHPLKVDIPDIIRESGVSLTEGQKGYFGRRIPSHTTSHLCRLMLPMDYYLPVSVFITKYDEIRRRAQNSFCRAFAEEFVRYCATLPDDFEDQMRISGAIGSEGQGVFDFWTLAPYVHLDLKQRGNTPDQSMAKIFEWIRGSDRNRMLHANFDAFEIYPLKEPLGYDERMPTHLRSRLVSKVVAREL
jgi:hypothetical protein